MTSFATHNKKLLFVGNDARYFKMHRLHLAMEARDAGYDVHVAIPRSEGEFEMSESGITFHSILLRRGGFKPLCDIAANLSLYRLFKNLEPDIIHLHTIKPVIFGGICAHIRGKCSVVSGITGLGHAFISKGIMARLQRRLVTLAYKYALDHPNYRVIFQNQDDMHEFVSNAVIRKECARLIRGSGVDLRKINSAPFLPGPPMIVLVSRMLWSKGVGEFVEAARRLKSLGYKARCVIVGDVDETNPAYISRKQIEMWREEGAVEFTGWVDDVISYYEKAHIVCLPSYREGVPRSLIEAAACGRPIVTTNAPGCREIVRDGVNGYLVPIGDALSLADALQKLIEDPELRRNMGARSREIAESEFSIEKVIAETLDVYRELLQ